MSSNRLFFILLIIVVVAGGGFLAFNILQPTAEPTVMPKIISSKRVTIRTAPLAKATPSGEVKKPGTPKVFNEKAPLATVQKTPAPKPVTKPAPKPTPKKTVKKTVQKTTTTVRRKTTRPWAVHVASYTSKKEARSLRSKLKKFGYNAYITKFRKSGVDWYRVRVGFYSTRSRAEKVSLRIGRKLKKKGFWLVQPKKNEVTRFTK